MACSRPRFIDGKRINCGSRFKSECEHCSRTYRLDWLAVMRAGFFAPVPYAAGIMPGYSYGLVTLTAPSFGKTKNGGRVHRVPKHPNSKRIRCGCGVTHEHSEKHLSGVPLDFAAYDYDEAVAWNRDMGQLFNVTRARMLRHYPGVSFVGVVELQSRLAAHCHLLCRVPGEGKPDAWFQAFADDLARQTTASNIDGVVRGWGQQADGRAFKKLDTPDGMLSTAGYLASVLGYMAADMTGDTKHQEGADSPLRNAHAALMAGAAHRMRCSNGEHRMPIVPPVPYEAGGKTWPENVPPVDSIDGTEHPKPAPLAERMAMQVGNPSDTSTWCKALVHSRYGLRQKQIWVARDWAFNGINRTKQRQKRSEWAASEAGEEARERKARKDLAAVTLANHKEAPSQPGQAPQAAERPGGQATPAAGQAQAGALAPPLDMERENQLQPLRIGSHQTADWNPADASVEAFETHQHKRWAKKVRELHPEAPNLASLIAASRDSVPLEMG